MLVSTEGKLASKRILELWHLRRFSTHPSKLFQFLRLIMRRYSTLFPLPERCILIQYHPIEKQRQCSVKITHINPKTTTTNIIHNLFTFYKCKLLFLDFSFSVLINSIIAFLVKYIIWCCQSYIFGEFFNFVNV